MPAAIVHLQDEDDSSPHPNLPAPPRRLRLVGQGDALPDAIASAIWRGDELGSPIATVVATGYPLLDAELPGGGWPCHALTEVLQPQPTVTEWRLLGPALRSVVAAGRSVVVVGPPKPPHAPGMAIAGIDPKNLIWIRAEQPAQRLWVTEQLIKANACGAIVAWLPQARQEQIRRLQVCATGFEGLTFLCRPAAAEHEASAAQLRVQITFGIDWELFVHVLKRKGATHEGVVRLHSVPGGLEAILTPRLSKPSELAGTLPPEVPSRELAADAVGRPVPAVVRDPSTAL